MAHPSAKKKVKQYKFVVIMRDDGIAIEASTSELAGGGRGVNVSPTRSRRTFFFLYNWERNILGW